MSSYVTNSVLTNIAKSNLPAASVLPTNDLSPSVILQKSNDGKNMKASIVYYFKLTPNEENLIISPGARQETIFRKILKRKLLLTSGNSSSIKVIVSTDDGAKEEMFFGKKNFIKLTYNSTSHALECTSDVKEVNLAVFIPKTSHRHSASSSIPRLDATISRTPSPLGAPIKYKTEIYSALKTSDTSSVYILESSENITLTPAEIDLAPPHMIQSPSARSASSIYPPHGILYLDTKHSGVTGYFSLNKKHLFPNLALTHSLNFNLRKIGKSPSILMTEDTILIEEVNVAISDPHISFYKFEHPYTPGIFEYSLEVSVSNDEMILVKEVIQETDEFLNLQTANFHNTPSNLEKMGLLFNKLHTLLGATPVQDFKGIFDNSTNPQALALDVFEYINSTSKILEKVYLFFRKPTGELVFSSNSVSKRDVRFHHTHQLPGTEDIFESTHTETEIRSFVTEQYSAQLEPLPFNVKYVAAESDYSNSELGGYYLDKVDDLKNSLGMVKKYEVKFYILEGYKENPRDNAVLMKHPKWNKIKSETEIPDNSFVRAAVSCSDGTQHEEYFTIGN